MNINELIGERVRAGREKLRLKQNDLANALQISPQAVSKWERGEHAPDIAVLVPLARLLDISTDFLLGGEMQSTDVFEATVFISGSAGYTAKAQGMPAKDLAALTNGYLYQITEAALRFDGVPVKYMGDGFLCFFSGVRHQQRSVQAAIRAKTMTDANLSIGLNSGEIYLGACGHPDYARSDIMGDTVNLAFRVLGWSGSNTQSMIAATRSVTDNLADSRLCGDPVSAELKGITGPVELCEIFSG